MLSADHRAIVKSTLPLLEARGDALTTHFYEMLLRENPELRPFFNQTNGTQKRALADGVLRYARHIDEPDKLGDLVATIVDKHVSLRIEPEHYPSVGACLLRSIRDILGAEVATGAVIEAWATVYRQLATILIDAETRIYKKAASKSDGRRGSH